MKYSEDLEIYKTKTGNYRIGKNTYHLGICKNCDEKCLLINNGEFCSKSCAISGKNHPMYGKNRSGENNPFYGKKHSEETKNHLSKVHTGKKLSEEHIQNISESKQGEKSHLWKGGVTKLDIPLYNTFFSQLEKYEEVRKSPDGYLEVKCTYCGKWYIPKRSEVQSRIKVINGSMNGECRLYCSKDCKQNCPIFHVIKYEKGSKLATSREVQPELRKLVFKRDNWTCIKCKATKNLHCHHIEGLNQNPIESADIDMCVTVCKPCHKNIHKQKDCGYVDLRCQRWETTI